MKMKSKIQLLRIKVIDIRSIFFGKNYEQRLL
jgi:hypothetical protein